MAFESKYLSVEQYLRRLSGLDKERQEVDKEVDVETVDEPITNRFDNPKSKVLPTECERNFRNTKLFRETEQEDFDLIWIYFLGFIKHY
ncbi:hypothetical protein JTE90_027157 [Oedothorax gibbosus]|uniref:Uncharacterized protein n=1 Tax=Oedothorax gibbosus TaxID=931172 RepID=A0AAV6TZ75_9ARAC|nr:hypothetical protein JTE90_027155 [Oedothorax gibbosus]KAG8176853.1 hypothetical protein JTE90_027157 [Oedothorax gibbosus]